MRNNTTRLLSVLLISASLVLHASALGRGVGQRTRTKTSSPPSTTSTPKDTEIVSGLREALSNGTISAISELGRDGGFLNNVRVKIPMPAPLRPIEKTLRFMGQQKMTDEFVATLNHAAEKAVV